METLRSIAVDIMERLRKEYSSFHPSAEKSMLLEDAIVDVLELRKNDIINSYENQVHIEDADSFLRHNEEEYDADGNRILLNRSMLQLLVAQYEKDYDSNYGTWDNFDTAHNHLMERNVEYRNWYESELDDEE